MPTSSKLLSPPLGEILADQLGDLLAQLRDFLADATEACDSHPDRGLAPVVRAKLRRTGQTAALLLDRLRNDLAGLTH